MFQTLIRFKDKSTRHRRKTTDKKRKQIEWYTEEYKQATQVKIQAQKICQRQRGRCKNDEIQNKE